MEIIFPDAPCCWYVYLQEFVIWGKLWYIFHGAGIEEVPTVGSGLNQTTLGTSPANRKNIGIWDHELIHKCGLYQGRMDGGLLWLIKQKLGFQKSNIVGVNMISQPNQRNQKV
jgi:hypothetical protein